MGVKADSTGRRREDYFGDLDALGVADLYLNIFWHVAALCDETGREGLEQAVRLLCNAGEMPRLNRAARVRKAYGKPVPQDLPCDYVLEMTDQQIYVEILYQLSRLWATEEREGLLYAAKHLREARKEQLRAREAASSRRRRKRPSNVVQLNRQAARGDQ